ncbi:hypothetical protein GCM10022252_53910 [Streptosporangium oxazolinicum]|uniref:Clp R domain-containing protein n=1 Tax=Streptosporangium oxazolinicum TaxID=909287 RepID=A0ABP8B8M5_9ACTN
MFERFTDRARRVVVLAQEEARGLSHDHIGTEHILLGLILEGDGVANRALWALGIGGERVRDDVKEIVGTGDEVPGSHIPFTPRAKKVLELSLREALGLHHTYIGTEHILLGLLREGEGVAAQVLTRQGARLEAVRAQVIGLLGPRVPDRAVAAEENLRVMGAMLSARLDRVQESLDRIERRLDALGTSRDAPATDGDDDTGTPRAPQSPPQGEQTS